MWTLLPLLFEFFISVFLSAIITRLSVPWLWGIVGHHPHYLAIIDKTPEIEIPAFIVFAFSFVVVSFVIFLLTQWAYQRFASFRRVVFHTDFVFVLYLLVTIGMNPLDFDRTAIILLPVCGVYLLLHKTAFQRYFDEIWLKRCLTLLVCTRGLILVVLYDIGVYRRVLLSHYPFIFAGSMGALMVYLGARRSIYQTLRRRFTTLWVAVACLLLISVSLIALVRRNPSIDADIYFTLLPAYHLAHGGVPFVSMMSQYGLLYLFPWLIWLLVFPNLSSPYVGATVVTALMLIGYFGLYMGTLLRIFQRSSIFFLTVMATFYITILVRDWGFADPVSLVSAPAFTPLRFGICILPLWFLISYWKTGTRSSLMVFALMSSGLFFYSFEMGVGLFAAAVSVVVIAQAQSGWKNALYWVGIFIVPLLFWCGVFAVYALATVGIWPRIVEYAYFSLLFGQGFFLHAMGGQYAIILPVLIACVGLYFGWYLFSQKKDRFGLIVIYLALIQLSQVPYYMGRSVFPTLYNISLPFLLLCGCIAEYLINRWGIVKKNSILFASLLVVLMALYVPAIRGFRITGTVFLHSAEEVERTVAHLSRAFSHWRIKDTPQYVFLSRYLPPDCSLAGFDLSEPELLMALERRPAFQYAFLRGFVTNKEQVNTLEAIGNADVCVFVNHDFIRTKDQFSYEVYEYFWEVYGQYATIIAQDKKANFSLYRIEKSPFIASGRKS
jgi:hypothetical protein